MLDKHSIVVAIISRTEDGGHTWQSTVFPAENLSPGPGMMSFINDQEGWVEAFFQGATGNDLVAIFRTTDGGKTWLPISQTPLGPALPNVPTSKPGLLTLSGICFGETNKAVLEKSIITLHSPNNVRVE